MSEAASPSPAPADPTSRRSGRASEDESTNGSKILAVVLALLCGGMGYGLYKRNASANAQAEADAKANGGLSNQVSELRTKLALELSNTMVAQSNHQVLSDRYKAALVNASNRIVQVSLLLSNAQHEASVAEAELPAKAAIIALLEAHRDELQRQVAALPVLEHGIVDLKDQLAQARFAYAALSETLGRARVEQATLERRLEDPGFLRTQAKRVEEAAEIRRRAAAQERIDPSDPRVRLELQPDGTVRPAISDIPQARK
jgi:hypothetical protein